MRLAQTLDVLQSLAPERLAEEWDAVGLQLGDPDWPVRRALLCIDLTEPVLQEAIAQHAELIVAYHPPVFKGFKALTTADSKQRLLLEAAQRRIAIYSPHTALDAAKDGINDWLCAGLGAGTARPIRPGSTPVDEARFVLVTFVPPEAVDRVRTALSLAGAGRIGNYTECSFSTEGQGTFKGGAGSQPTIGRAGRLERVAERRMEMTCPAHRVADVISALRENHPYEEPAFDLYRVELAPTLAGAKGFGQGRILTLDKPTSAATLAARFRRHTGLTQVQMGTPAPGMQRPLKKIGVCAGAGGSLIPEAGDIDAFVTGEMRHHEVLSALAAGLTVVLGGHSETERPYLPIYRRRLKEAAGEVDWRVSRTDKAPLRVVR